MFATIQFHYHFHNHFNNHHKRSSRSCDAGSLRHFHNQFHNHFDNHHYNNYFDVYDHYNEYIDNYQDNNKAYHNFTDIYVAFSHNNDVFNDIKSDSDDKISVRNINKLFEYFSDKFEHYNSIRIQRLQYDFNTGAISSKSRSSSKYDFYK